MKAISIKQPWASLIAHGIKDIENRTWKCPQKYIGQRILIHASSSKPVFNYSLPQYYTIRKSSQSLIFNCTYDGFPKGAIIGSVVIEPSFNLGRERLLELGTEGCGSL